MVYRRTSEEMTAYDFEFEVPSVKQEGVEFVWLSAPSRIIGDEDGNVKALECTGMRLEAVGDGAKKAGTQ